MNTSQLFLKAHKLIEAKEIRDINYHEMASRIGVSPRTYTEYIRGNIQPKYMSAIMNLLTELDNDDLLKIVDEWRKNADTTI